MTIGTDSEPDHVCDSGHFDRTVCPEPCGYMHSFCSICGRRADACAHDRVSEMIADGLAYAQIIDALKKARLARGMRQVDVAEIMGGVQSWISNIETMTIEVEVRTLQRYARALGGRIDMKLVME